MKNIRRGTYALYKAGWVLEHVTDSMLAKTYMEYCQLMLVGIVDVNTTFEEYIEEYGFDGEIYSSYSEFLHNEYQNEEYMTSLLGKKSDIYEAWRTDTMPEE